MRRLVVAAVLASGCSADAPEAPPPLPVVTVTLDPVTATIGVHGTQNYEAVPRGSSNQPLDGRTVAFSTSDTTIAVVDATGRVTSRAAGTVSVRATSEGISATVTLVVEPFLALVSLTAGSQHTCGLDASGRAWCWGANGSGQLGDSTFDRRYRPVAVRTALRFTAISAGRAHTCALTTGGEIHCWGNDRFGQLGDGDTTTTSRSAPGPVASGVTWRALDAGAEHVCGLSTGGLAYCWGRDFDGQSGAAGSGGDLHGPTSVQGALTFASISAGQRHTCALTSLGEAHCWGSDALGALGDSTGNGVRRMPTAVSTAWRFTSITSGDERTCAITSTAMAVCWGDNSNGAVGDGSRVDRPLPVAIQSNQSHVALTTGANHSCGGTTGANTFCWGANGSGQLGVGGVPLSVVPVRVTDSDGFRQLVAGLVHSCALRVDLTAVCWGDGLDGALGDDRISAQPRVGPVRVVAP